MDRKYNLNEVTPQELPKKRSYKLCVYTICKNEEKHVNRWMERLVDADLVYILDTGSTDRTVHLFQQYSNVKLDVFLQDDFDFSVARNECYKNARKHCSGKIEDWIFVSLDLDEFLEPLGIQKLKYYWDSSMDVYLLFDNYCDNAFRYHKVHSSANWVWKNKVHEMPVHPFKSFSDWSYTQKHRIEYSHEQDLTKQRPYKQLLIEMNSTASRTLFCCGVESFDLGQYEDAVKYLTECIHIATTDTTDMHYNSNFMISVSYATKINSLIRLNAPNINECLDEFESEIKKRSSYPSRTLNGIRASLLFDQQEYRKCINVLLPLINSDTYYAPEADLEPWNDLVQIMNLIALSYNKLNDYHNAQVYASKAAQLYETKLERGLMNENK